MKTILRMNDAIEWLVSRKSGNREMEFIVSLAHRARIVGIDDGFILRVHFHDRGDIFVGTISGDSGGSQRLQLDADIVEVEEFLSVEGANPRTSAWKKLDEHFLLKLGEGRGQRSSGYSELIGQEVLL